MNQYIKVSVIGIGLLLSTLDGRADQTNLVQNLTIKLNGITSGPTETNRNSIRTTTQSVRINTSDVLKQLGTATGNTFSDKAQLVVVTPLPGGSSTIQVRDGTSSVDVSSFFVYEARSGMVARSFSNLKTGTTLSSDYSVQHLALVDSSGLPALTMHFDTQGIAVQVSASGPNTATRSNLEANVSGWGDESAETVILEGAFRIEGYLLEVVPSSPPNA